jgi:hypothetical protein
MELSSWPEHFRNLITGPTGLAFSLRMRDDNAASSVGPLLFGARSLSREIAPWHDVEVCILESKSSTGIRSSWPAALCAVALGCFLVLSGFGAAQSATSSDASGKTTQAKTTTPKKPAAASHSSAAKSTTSAKTHTAAHPATGVHSKTTANSSRNGKSTQASARRTGKSRKKTVARGQQKIDPERAQAIQEALIREHYMSGEPAGTWNEASEAAIRRYQADHGWQSKTVPDARALISLGLGPSHDHLLNPESAMTTGPDASQASSIAPVSHSPEPGVSDTANPAPAVIPTAATHTPATTPRQVPSPQ